MKNLLVGNGIDIQFGGEDYFNRNIITRAIENIKTNNFNPEVYPKEIAQWFICLYGEFTEVIKGTYDEFIVATYEEASIKDLKRRYKGKKKIWITDIGIEDYMFINELFCRKNKIYNPQKFEFKEILKRWILDSIYNNGNINNIHQKFPLGLKHFFALYDNIFTTNYDENIAKFTGQEVGYLHGAFHILDEVYDEKSFRNQLSDCPVKDYNVVKGYEYLYSNALMSFAGEIKSFSMEAHYNTNQAIDKFIKGMKENPEIEKDIEKWKDSDSQSVRNMYEAIMLKMKNKELRFSEPYSIEKFRYIEGAIDILGLSPNNDNHLFTIINNNEKLDRVSFYYFDKGEILEIRKILNKKKVDVFSVKELWEKYK